MNYFTEEEWKRIPLTLKQKWWKESNYGKSPTKEIIEELKEAAKEKRNFDI